MTGERVPALVAVEKCRSQSLQRGHVSLVVLIDAAAAIPVGSTSRSRLQAAWQTYVRARSLGYTQAWADGLFSALCLRPSESVEVVGDDRIRERGEY